jgi:hypothetical protein
VEHNPHRTPRPTVADFDLTLPLLFSQKSTNWLLSCIEERVNAALIAGMRLVRGKAERKGGEREFAKSDHRSPLY